MNHTNPLSASCATATAWIHLLLDDALTAEQRAQLQAHVHTCESCKALLRDLERLEAAHATHDARMLTPPQDYFAGLPKRVLARIAAAEAVTPAPVPAPAPRARASQWREFFFGRGRYALAFAAMLTLVFVVTQQLRERGATEKIGEQAAQTAFKEVPESNAPAEQSVPTPAAQAPATVKNLSKRAKDAVPEARVPAPSSIAEEPAQPITNLPRFAEAEGEASHAVLADTLAARTEQQAEGGLHFVRSQQAEPPRVEVKSLGSEPNEAALPSSSALAKTQRLFSESKQSVMNNEQARGIAAAPPRRERDLYEVLARAAKASGEAERIKLWQQYLGYTVADSASYNAAMTALARRLAHEIDSTTSVAHMQAALSFYQTLAPAVINQMGTSEFERELTRLERLLNGRTAAER